MVYFVKMLSLKINLVKETFIFGKNTHILTSLNSWLITLSLAVPFMSKVALEQISEWKGAT